MSDQEIKYAYGRRPRPAVTAKANEKFEHILDDLDLLHEAFPDGPLKHREAHEAWIAAKEAEANFYTSLRTEVMKKGVAGIFSLLVIILGLALTGLGHQLIDSGFFSGGK